MAETAHKIRIMSGSLNGEFARAECSCGWHGVWRAILSGSAPLDGNEHSLRAAGEGDT